MFKNTFQSGLLSIFYSCGSQPLAIWDMQVHNGHIKRVTDTEVNSIVLEIVSTNVATTFISCPRKTQVLGIRLPFLVMVVKNMKRYFSFEIMILDDKNMRRRFRISNFQSTTKIKPFCTSMPIGLSGGWNQIQFNLSDFTQRAYGTQYIETLRVQVHANSRLRRIYFCDRLYTEEELPQEYKLYLPLNKKDKKSKAVKVEDLAKTKANGPPPPPPAGEGPPPSEVQLNAERPPAAQVPTPVSMAEVSKTSVVVEKEGGDAAATEGDQEIVPEQAEEVADNDEEPVTLVEEAPPETDDAEPIVEDTPAE